MYLKSRPEMLVHQKVEIQIGMGRPYAAPTETAIGQKVQNKVITNLKNLKK